MIGALIGLTPILLPSPASAIAGTVAVLQGLDKITARVSTFEAPIDKPVRFGTLEITVDYCDRAPPEDPPESAAFLDIREIKAGSKTPVELFQGWMFASSPALSALQHPVYDVWVLDCRTSSASNTSSTSKSPKSK